MINKSIMLIGAVAGGLIGFFLKDTLGFGGILFGLVAGAVGVSALQDILKTM